MRKTLKIGVSVVLWLCVAWMIFHFPYGETIAVLNPKGEIGIKQKDLLLLATGLMLIVVIPVFAMTFWFIWKYREKKNPKDYHPEWDYNLLAESIWWGFPLIIILILSVFTWKSSHELDPFKPLQSEEEPLTVQVVALQWKWLFIYPSEGIATLNFLKIPEKRPINFELTSDAPMNSFWIPQLGGQIYAMPGMRSKLHLIANQTGTFRGCSAHLSGEGFSGMTFMTEAVSEDDFEAWVCSVKRSSYPLDQDTYEPLIEPSKNNPVELYRLTDEELFNQIIHKYEGT